MLKIALRAILSLYTCSAVQYTWGPRGKAFVPRSPDTPLHCMSVYPLKIARRAILSSHTCSRGWCARKKTPYGGLFFEKNTPYAGWGNYFFTTNSWWRSKIIIFSPRGGVLKLFFHLEEVFFEDTSRRCFSRKNDLEEVIFCSKSKISGNFQICRISGKFV